MEREDNECKDLYETYNISTDEVEGNRVGDK